MRAVGTASRSTAAARRLSCAGGGRAAAPQARAAEEQHNETKRKQQEALKHELQREARGYQAAKYAEGSKKKISTAMRAYTAFCEDTGEWPHQTRGISDEQMELLVAYLARRVQYSTVKEYICMGVRLFHLEHGIPYKPIKERYSVEATLQGVRREKGDTATRRKLPITLSLLRRMRAQLDMTEPNDIAFWAASLLAFFCLLRKGHITGTSKKAAVTEAQLLRKSNITRRADGRLWLSMDATKTIQFRERTLETPIPRLADKAVCPTRAMEAYLYVAQDAPGDILFQVIDSADQWTPLTYGPFLKQVKNTLAGAGAEPAAYAGHSFRRGGATWLMEIGVPIPTIKAMGDWRSDAYLAYLEIDKKVRRKAASMMESAVRKLKGLAKRAAKHWGTQA